MIHTYGTIMKHLSPIHMKKLIRKILKEFGDKVDNVYCVSNKESDALPVVVHVKKDNKFVTKFQI